MADRKIEELTVKQGQQRDAKENKPFDREMDAYRRGKENLTDEQRIDRLKDNADLRKRLDEAIDNKANQALAAEAAVGIAADFVTAPLLASPIPGSRPLYYGLNYGVGYGANILAQKYRGEKEINQGEALAAGGFQTIPFGTTARGLKGVTRAAAKGGTGAIVGEQVRVGIDEGRLLTPKEQVSSFATGAVFGGGLKGVIEVSSPKKAVGNKIIQSIDREQGVWENGKLTFSDGSYAFGFALPTKGSKKLAVGPSSVEAEWGKIPTMKRQGESGLWYDVKVLDSTNIKQVDDGLHALAMKEGYKQLVSTKIRKTKKAPTEIGTIYLNHAEQYFLKKGNFDEFPVINVGDTILKPKIKTYKKVKGEVVDVTAAFVNPFDTQRDNIGLEIKRLVKAERMGSYDKKLYTAPEFHEATRKAIKELEEADAVLKNVTDIQGHHIAPIALSHRFFENLDSPVDRAWLTAHLANYKNGKVFLGNHPLNSEALPSSVHTYVHDFINKEVQKANFDFNKIATLPVNERIEHIEKFAEIILQSQNKAWEKLDQELLRRGQKIGEPSKIRRTKKLIGSARTSKILSDLDELEAEMVEIYGPNIDWSKIRRDILDDAPDWDKAQKKRFNLNEPDDTGE